MLQSYCMIEEGLSPKQERVLIKIKGILRSKGRAPTIEELRSELGYKSLNSVSQLLAVLEKKGFIKRTKKRERNIVVKTQEEIVQVPIIGNITCGMPILAQQNIQGYLPVSKAFLKGDIKDFFVLKAIGNSMNRAGIDDGDYVLVKSQQIADPGDKVVALINDEATIKLYKPSKDYVALVPKSSDPTHRPIILNKDFLIQGVVKRVIKKDSLKT